MKVSCDEGLASHTGPESCVGVREGAGEALTACGERSRTGVRAGWVLSPEIDASGVPTRFTPPEGHTGRVASARPDRAPRDRRPQARTQASHTEAGRSRAWLGPRFKSVP